MPIDWGISPGILSLRAGNFIEYFPSHIRHILPFQEDESEEVSCPKVTCLNCNYLVSMGSVREHQLTCCGGSSSSTSSGANGHERRCDTSLTLSRIHINWGYFNLMFYCGKG